MHPRYFWAILLIVGGIVLLLNNLGILSVDIWGVIWPLVLVLLGVGFLVGAVNRRGSVQTVTDSLHLEEATSARIKFAHGAGRLFVHAGANPNQLYTGTFGGDMNRKVNRSGDRLDVSLSAEPVSWSPWGWWGGSNGLDWDVALNPVVPLTLEFETGASQTELDLSQLSVADLRLQTGASSTTITMPAQAGMTRARIESGAASVRVRIPDSVAAHISGTMGLGSLEVNRRRFPRKGNAYESEDYTTAPNRIDVQVEGGVGAVQIS